MHSTCCHASLYGYPAMPWYVPVCPWCGLPFQSCACWSRQVPAGYQVQQEISADPASAEKAVMIGGVSQVRVTLEYMPVEGAAAPSVKVVLTDPDGTATTIDETSVSTGYHVKADMTPLVPGTMVKLTIQECMARLRWLETFNY